MKVRNRKVVLSVIVAMVSMLAVAAMLSGCSKPSTMEEYCEKTPELQEQMQSVADQLADAANILVPGSSAEVSVTENEFLFLITLGPDYTGDDDGIIASALDSSLQSYEDGGSMSSAIADIEDATGISPVTFVITFQDSAGNVVATRTFTS